MQDLITDKEENNKLCFPQIFQKNNDHVKQAD